MSGSFLELMGATAGALALIDRLTENPQARSKRRDGDVFVSWRDPITRKAREQRVTVVPQGIQLARRLIGEGARDVEVIEYNRGTEFVAWSPGMEHENPRGRSKGPITRRSQATGDPPTKRLIARRRKTVRAPKGFFANPVGRCFFGIKVNAGNDVNGNPRKAVAFFVHDGKTASLLGVVQEQHAGMQGVFREINLDPATTPVIGEFDVSVLQFRSLLKMRPGIMY